MHKVSSSDLTLRTDTSSRQQSDFTYLLDAEINNLRSEIQRPGWTTWAIYGGLATLVWLLLSEIQQARYSIREVSGLLLVIWLMYWPYIYIKSCVNPSGLFPNLNSRLHPGYFLRGTRLLVIIFLALQIYFIVVALDFSRDVGNLATTLVCIEFAFLLLMMLVGLVLSFVELPFPASPNTGKLSVATSVFLVLITAIPLGLYLNYLLISPAVANLFDVRFALIIAGIFLAANYVIARIIRKSYFDHAHSHPARILLRQNGSCFGNAPDRYCLDRTCCFGIF